MKSFQATWEDEENNAVEIFYTMYSSEAVGRDSAETEDEVLERLLEKTAEKVVERAVRGWWVDEPF